jgi:hypothetical protein
MPIDPGIQRFTYHDNEFELGKAIRELSTRGNYLAPVDLRERIDLLVVGET